MQTFYSEDEIAVIREQQKRAVHSALAVAAASGVGVHPRVRAIKGARAIK